MTNAIQVLLTTCVFLIVAGVFMWIEKRMRSPYAKLIPQPKPSSRTLAREARIGEESHKSWVARLDERR